VTEITVFHTATAVVTVLQAVVDTSTIVSTVEVTMSGLATQTDVTYVTITAAATQKRAVVPEIEVPENLNAFQRLARRVAAAFGLGEAPSLVRRAAVATQAPLPPTQVTNLVTVTVTSTNDVTSLISTTTTAPTTSTVLKTVFQTKTK
jgi:hypothetical protein